MQIVGEQKLDVNEHLHQLSDSLNWVELEKDIVSILGSSYGPAVRLVCGTVYLKSFFDLSTAEVIGKWLVCPKFRYFCGESAAIEDTIHFPMPQHALDMLTRQLNAEAHDVMVKALLATSIDCYKWQPKVVTALH